MHLRTSRISRKYLASFAPTFLCASYQAYLQEKRGVYLSRAYQDIDRYAARNLWIANLFFYHYNACYAGLLIHRWSDAFQEPAPQSPDQFSCSLPSPFHCFTSGVDKLFPAKDQIVDTSSSANQKTKLINKIIFF